MTYQTEDGSLNRIARITGILILVTAVFAPFSMIYVPSALIVAGDAATTANNIMASEGLFRAAIASDALVFLIEIALSALLYGLLKPVSCRLSLAAAFSRQAMAVVQGVNLFNYLLVLLLVGGAGYLNVFEPGQLDALVLLFLDAHESVALIWGLFFGLHLLLLGYLVYRSGYIPKLIGIFLGIASLCYLIPNFGNILSPDRKQIYTVIGLFSMIELVFPLWLLIKGVNVQPTVYQDAR